MSVDRWKKTAEVPLTGNLTVDTVLIEELRVALRLTCAQIGQLEDESKRDQERITYWKDEVKKLQKKNQELKESFALTIHEARRIRDQAGPFIDA